MGTAPSQLITDNFDIVGSGDTPTNFIKFPYDWRRSNREAAAALKELLGTQLHAWRAWSHWKHAKVILLAHSMAAWFRATTSRC